MAGQTVQESSYIKEDRYSMFSPMEKRMSAKDPFSSLMSIDFMVTELCNLTCDFCPRSKGYPNLNLHMDLSIIEKVCDDLADLKYKNRIVFCGFGEPLLYKHLSKAIKIIKSKLPWQENIQIITNGHRLTKSKMKELYDIGVNKISVSMYEGAHQVKKFENIFKDIDTSKYLLQHYYFGEEEDYGFSSLSNRAGYNFKETNCQKSCNMPFYAMNIHYDGDVLLCCHDWKKSVSMGNVMKKNVGDVWVNSLRFNKYRQLLQNGRKIDPCKDCNIEGEFYGNKSKNILLSRLGEKCH